MNDWITNLGQVLLQWLPVRLQWRALFPSLSDTNLDPLSAQKVLEDFNKFIHHSLVLGVAVGEKVEWIDDLRRKCRRVVVEIQSMRGNIMEI